MIYHLSICPDSDACAAWYASQEGYCPYGGRIAERVNSVNADGEAVRDNSIPATLAVIAVGAGEPVYPDLVLFSTSEYAEAKSACEALGMTLPEDASLIPTLAGVTIS